MADRYKAQLDGFELDVESIDDQEEKAVAVHEYPNVDGADLEELGMRARQIRLRTHWFNESYEIHRNFVAHLRVQKRFELIHPRYGTVYGKAVSWGVRYNDTPEHAAVDFTFVEEIAEEDTVPVFAPRIVEQVEENFIEGQTELATTFGEGMRTAIGAEAATVLGKVIDISKPALDQMTGLAWKARQYVKDIDTVMGVIDGTLTTVTNPANTLLSVVDFGTDLPGRVLSILAETVERYVLSAASVSSTPSRLVDSVKSGVTALKNSVDALDNGPAIGSLLLGQAALFVSTHVARMYSDDEADREALAVWERTKSFNEQGDFVRTGTAPEVMSINELEESLYNVRSMIQDAVDATRENTILKTVARNLFHYVNEQKLKRSRIVTIKVTRPIPLHMLCMQRGLPYNAAPRILAINPQITNPSYVEGDIEIYV